MIAAILKAAILHPMQSTATKLRVSREDFLSGESISELKHEMVAGHVYAMSGGSMNHQRVSRNFNTQAGNGLKGKGCEATNSDFLLRLDLGNNDEAFYYPDAMIVCQPIAGSDRFTEAPTVILEVLSHSTRRNDEVQKLRDYLTIPSVQSIILSEADSPDVRIYRRKESGFVIELLSGMHQTLELPEVNLSIPFTELFRDVDFESKEPLPKIRCLTEASAPPNSMEVPDAELASPTAST